MKGGESMRKLAALAALALALATATGASAVTFCNSGHYWGGNGGSFADGH
jgi:hypothetical protein